MSYLDETGIEGDYFFVKSDKKLEKIRKQEIVYLEGMGNYLAIHTGVKKIVVYGSLKVIEEKLASLNLIVIHKSYRVPLHRIEGMTTKKVILEKTELPLSRNYKAQLEKILSLKRIV
jgi:two-component system, LytTR family, response regulator